MKFVSSTLASIQDWEGIDYDCVFMFGHLEGRTRFVFECFDPRPDHEGKNTYMVSYFEKGLRRRDVVDVPCYMNVSAKS